MQEIKLKPKLGKKKVQKKKKLKIEGIMYWPDQQHEATIVDGIITILDSNNINDNNNNNNDKIKNINSSNYNNSDIYRFEFSENDFHPSSKDKDKHCVMTGTKYFLTFVNNNDNDNLTMIGKAIAVDNNQEYVGYSKLNRNDLLFGLKFNLIVEKARRNVKSLLLNSQGKEYSLSYQDFKHHIADVDRLEKECPIKTRQEYLQRSREAYL